MRTPKGKKKMKVYVVHGNIRPNNLVFSTFEKALEYAIAKANKKKCARVYGYERTENDTLRTVTLYEIGSCCSIIELEERELDNTDY